MSSDRSLPVPVDAALTGQGFYFQWLLPDPDADPSGLAVSHGGRVILGGRAASGGARLR